MEIYITNETPPRAFESAGTVVSILRQKGFCVLNVGTVHFKNLSFFQQKSMKLSLSLHIEQNC